MRAGDIFYPDRKFLCPMLRRSFCRDIDVIFFCFGCGHIDSASSFWVSLIRVSKPFLLVSIRISLLLFERITDRKHSYIAAIVLRCPQKADFTRGRIICQLAIGFYQNQSRTPSRIRNLYAVRLFTAFRRARKRIGTVYYACSGFPSELPDVNASDFL
jgi:hypothetical protein